MWIALPPIALAVLGLSLLLGDHLGYLILAGCALAAAVVAAVHHAEVIAHRVGEPFGTLILAIAITVIEASLIISMMLSGGAETAVLPRDTLFAAVMIISNGVVGICLLVGGYHHREQTFRIEGSSAGISVLIALSGVTMVIPAFTPDAATGAGHITTKLLTFVGAGSLLLWGTFVFAQTVRHRDYFLPTHPEEDATHAEPPSKRAAWQSFALLLVALVSVVGLAKALAPSIESGLIAAGAPQSALGIAVALIVLAPETWAAVRAARANRLQTSMNLALGSALASIGLTVPVVAVTSVVLDLPVVLGLEPVDIALLTVTFLVSAFTLAQGRTNFVQGMVHLVLFGAFLHLALIP